MEEKDLEGEDDEVDRVEKSLEYSTSSASSIHSNCESSPRSMGEDVEEERDIESEEEVNNCSCCSCSCQSILDTGEKSERRRIAFKDSQLVQHHSIVSNANTTAATNIPGYSFTDGFKTGSTETGSNNGKSCMISHPVTPPNPTSFTSSFLITGGGNASSLGGNQIAGMVSVGCASAYQQPLRIGKTPKTIYRRGRVFRMFDQESDQSQSGARHQVFGTPDYLSPELLRGEPHNESVDWWALGVCLYEFLVGITPFADQTPELIFDNILNGTIEWPGEVEGEALSESARSAILNLLNPVPGERMQLTHMRSHPLFASVNWSNLLNEQPPFVPKPDHSMDTFYFDKRNEMQNIKMSESLINIRNNK